MTYIIKKTLNRFYLLIFQKSSARRLPKSQKAFGEKLDQKGKVFAYPYGAQNKDLEDYMLQDGIQGIFTLSPGVVTNETLYSNIPRLIVMKDNWKTIKHWLLSEGTQ